MVTKMTDNNYNNISKNNHDDLTDEEIKNIREQKLKELAEDQEQYYKRQARKEGIPEFGNGNDNGKTSKKKKNKKQNGKSIKKLLKIAETNTVEGNEEGEETEEEEYENEEDEDKEQENPKEFLFKFAESHIPLLFKDQFGKLFAYVKINDNNNYDLMLLTSNKFEKYIYKIFYESEYKLILPKDLRKEIIEHLQYKAEFSGIIKKLDLRVAKTEGNDYTFYYDLTNSNEGITAIKITPEGWSYENNPPILFRRFANQLPQVNPSFFLTINDKDDKIFDKFLSLLNVKDDDNKLLLKCYIVSLFIPGIAKPILMLSGEQGSAKTTLQELIKMLVDPSIVKTLTFPRDINELVQQLSHNYIAYYENLSNIKEWISDALCRGVTGTGFSKRQLYSDDEDIIYFFQRCIGFNGINSVATKADLLDRGIIIQLERIPKQNRRKIEDIWNEFEIIKPSLLAYIFDILVKVLQVKQKGGITIAEGLNRMADFEENAEIISRCMGYQENEFLRVYQNNINIQIDEAIQASPLSMAVVELMDDYKEGEELIDNATELYLELNDIAETKLKINVQKISFWPKSPNHLSRRLNEIKTNLREKGIEIERYKDEKGHRKIKIRKVSSISTYRQESKNHAQNPGKSLDDILDDTKKVSSNQNEENYEQNNDFGRLDDKDDTLPLSIHGIYPHSDTWECDNCNWTGDKWFMKNHPCKYNKQKRSKTEI